MNLNNQYAPYKHKGFSLIELMIGMVIGLLATLAISQSMSVFEGQKRGTTGTADAQTSGGIALYNISRELKLAGYPLMPSGQPGVIDSPLECTSINYHSSGVSSITPVSITNGVAAAGVNASDSITIRYGNSASGGSPTTLDSRVGNVATVRNNLGCQANDIVLMNNGPDCVLTRATAVAGTVAPFTVTTVDTVGDLGSDFSCLGRWDEVTYRVNNGNLERSVDNVNFTPVVADIINLQAQYGISNSPDSNTITQWVEPTGATWAAPTVANRNLIKAVRLAIVARNPQIDTNTVTASCNAANFTGLCAWQDVPIGGAISVASPAPAINLSTADANWGRYHYRVFETIIPMRNVVWSRETL
jgi:type IV pilus assembly protein PilW